MPKFTIELDSETHRILKENARKDERSLTQYMQRILRQSAGTLIIDDSMATSTTNNTTTNLQQSQNNTTTNLQSQSQPQKQTPRKNVIVGAEFDEDLNFNEEGKLTWRR